MIVPAADVRLVLTTVGSSEEAERIARFLVENRLAACVNLVSGLTSVYRWRDDVETAQEILLLIKTTGARLEALEAALHRLHSYEVAEFLVLHPESGGRSYLDWLLQATSP